MSVDSNIKSVGFLSPVLMVRDTYNTVNSLNEGAKQSPSSLPQCGGSHLACLSRICGVIRLLNPTLGVTQWAWDAAQGPMRVPQATRTAHVENLSARHSPWCF